MSQDIDERILSMQFDNRKFQDNIQETSESLDKFQEKLEFKDSDKGLDKLKGTFSNFATGAVTAFDTIGRSALSMADLIRISVIDRLGGDLYNWGKRMAKSLSIDQVTAGLTKYEQQTKSSFTIMAATGKSVDEVDKALERLMWFSDETSYSFTDMVDNVGKFTSQNIDLDQSIKAMQGIATAAALAGQGTASASRAMYNFAQSLAQGSVKLMDWKSIENANMATAEFKQTIIDTAKEVGTLNKESKTKKGTLVSAQTFSSTLSEAWFTSDVLIKSLEKYGGYADKLFEYIETNDVDTAAQAMREMGSAGDELGMKAFKAAQEARSFTDAIEATKDAVSSGWMQTFKLIIGNTDQATELFTDMANALWEVFAGGSEARNELLQLWNEAGGREKLLRGIYDALEGLWSIITNVKEAILWAFPDVTVKRLMKLTNKVEEFGASLKKTFGIIKKIEKSEETISEEVLNRDWNFNETLEQGMRSEKVRMMQEELKELGYDIGTAQADGIFGPKTQAALDRFQKEYKLTASGVYDEATHFAIGKALWGTHDVEKTKELTEETEELSPALEKLHNIFSGLSYVGRLVAETFAFIKEAVSKVINVFRPLFSVVGDIAEKFFNILGKEANNVIKSGIFFRWLHDMDGTLVPFGEKISALAEKIRSFLGLDKEFNSFGEWIDHIKNSIMGLFGGSGEGVGSGIVDAVSGTVEKVSGTMNTLQTTISGGGVTVFQKVKGWFTSIKDLFKGGEAKEAADGAEQTGESVGVFGKTIEKIKSIFAGKSLGDIIFTIGKIYLGFKAFQGVIGFFSIGTKLAKGIGGITKAVTGAVKGFGGIGEALSDRIKGKKPESIATAILKIAASIALIAAALYVVANLDATQALKAAGILFGMMAVVTIFVLIIKKLDLSVNAKALNSITQLSIGMFLLSLSVRMLGELDSAQALQGIMALGLVMAELAVFIAVTDKMTPGTSLGKMLGLAVFLLAATRVVRVLGEMDPWKALQGVVALGLVMAELAVFLVITNNTNPGTGLAKMLGLSVFLLAASKVIRTLGEMNPLKALQGVVTLGLVMAELAVFVYITNGLKSGTGITRMLGLSVFLLAASRVIKTLGEMEPAKALQGVVALGLVLTELVVFIKMTDKLNAGTRILQMVGLSIFLFTAANVIQTLGTMDPYKALQGIVALGLVMGEIALLMASLGRSGVQSLATSAVLAGVASALAIMVQLVVQLSELDPWKSLQAVVVLGSIAAVLALSMYSLNAVGKPKLTTLISILAVVAIFELITIAFNRLTKNSLRQTLTGAVAIGVSIAALAAAVLVANHLRATRLNLKTMLMLAAISGVLILIAAGLALAVHKIKDVNPQIMVVFSVALAEMFGALLSVMALTILAQTVGMTPSSLMKGSLAIAATFAIIVAVATAILVGLGSLDKIGKGDTLVSRIKAGGKVLKELAKALDIFDDPMTTMAAAAAALGAFTIVGWTGAGKPVVGAASVTAAFGIAAGISTAVVTGLGYIDEAISKSSTGDETGLVEKVNRGGRVLEAVAGAINVFNFDTPMDQLTNAAEIIAGWTVAGWIGGVKIIIGSASIGAAFSIAAAIGVAVVGGLGAFDAKLAQNSVDGETGLVEYIQRGGEVLKAVADAINVFDFAGPMDKIVAAAGVIAGTALIGAFGSVAVIVGSAAIGAAFAIAVDIGVAVVSGLGVLSEFSGVDQETGETGLIHTLNEGGRVFESIGGAFGSFVGGFQKMKSFVTGVPLAGSEEDKAQTMSAFFKSLIGFGDTDTGSELDSAFSAVEKVAEFMDKIGGYEHISLAPDKLNTIFSLTGADPKTVDSVVSKTSGITAFEVVVQAIYKMAKAFNDNKAEFDSVEFFNETTANYTKLEGLIAAMTKIAEFMNDLGGNEFKDLEKGATKTLTIGNITASVETSMTAYETVLSGVASTVETFNSLFSKSTFSGTSTWDQLRVMTTDIEDETSDIYKLQSVLDLMIPIANFMNDLGGKDYPHIENAPGKITALFKDATAYQTVLNAVGETVKVFGKTKYTTTTGNVVSETEGLIGILNTMPVIYGDEDGVDGMKMKGIVDLMTQIAGFMDAIGQLKIEHEPSWWTKVFGEGDSSFNTVLSGVKSSVTTFKSVQTDLKEDPITDDTVDQFNKVVTMLNRLVGTMRQLNSIKITYDENGNWTGALTGNDLLTFLGGVKGHLDIVSAIADLPDFDVGANGAEGKKLSGIITIMTDMANFMATLDTLTIEKEPSWWQKVFGEGETAFNTVLIGVKNAVGDFKEIHKSLNGADDGVLITDFTVKQFGRITTMLTSLAGVMDQLSKIKAQTSSDGSFISGTTWQDLIGFLESLKNQVGSFDDIVGSKDYSKYMDIITSYTEMYGKLAELVAAFNSGDLKVKDDGTGGPLQAIANAFATSDTSSMSLVDSAIGSIGAGAVSTLNGYYSEFKRSGAYAAEGYGRGLSNTKWAIDAARALVRAAHKELDLEQGTGSPAREYIRSGMYAAMGYAKGLDDYSYLAQKAAGEVANDSFKTIQNSIASLSTALAEGIDATPTIRPVLDLTDISSGAEIIDGLLSDRSLNVDTSTRIARSVAKSADGSSTLGSGNSDVVSAIVSLRDDLNSLIEGFGNMQVVMDSGALVGSIGSKMDLYLGRKAIRERRRG